VKTGRRFFLLLLQAAWLSHHRRRVWARLSTATRIHFSLRCRFSLDEPVLVHPNTQHLESRPKVTYLLAAARRRIRFAPASSFGSLIDQAAGSCSRARRSLAKEVASLAGRAGPCFSVLCWRVAHLGALVPVSVTVSFRLAFLSLGASSTPLLHRATLFFGCCFSATSTSASAQWLVAIDRWRRGSVAQWRSLSS
jgi:hypothetical protein